MKTEELKCVDAGVVMLGEHGYILPWDISALIYNLYKAVQKQQIQAHFTDFPLQSSDRMWTDLRKEDALF